MANTFSKVGAVELANQTNPLANALLFQGAEQDQELQQLLREELRGRLLEGQRVKKMRERAALSAIDATRDAAMQKANEQSRCSHRKIDNSTRLGGQFLSGTGQLCLTCQYCHIEYFAPPNAALGQVAPPRELIPPADQIGG